MNRKQYHEEPYALSLDWLSFYMTILPDSPLITNPPFEEFSHSNVVLRFVQSQERTHSTRYRAWSNWRSLYEIYVNGYNIGVLGIDHLLVSQLSKQCLFKINNEYLYHSPGRIIGYINRLYEVLHLQWNGLERIDIALYSYKSFVQWYLRNIRYSSINKVWIVGKPITNGKLVEHEHIDGAKKGVKGYYAPYSDSSITLSAQNKSKHVKGYNKSRDMEPYKVEWLHRHGLSGEQGTIYNTEVKLTRKALTHYSTRANGDIRTKKRVSIDSLEDVFNNDLLTTLYKDTFQSIIRVKDKNDREIEYFSFTPTKANCYEIDSYLSTSTHSQKQHRLIEKNIELFIDTSNEIYLHLAHDLANKTGDSKYMENLIMKWGLTNKIPIGLCR